MAPVDTILKTVPSQRRSYVQEFRAAAYALTVSANPEKRASVSPSWAPRATSIGIGTKGMRAHATVEADRWETLRHWLP